MNIFGRFSFLETYNHHGIKTMRFKGYLKEGKYVNMIETADNNVKQAGNLLHRNALLSNSSAIVQP